MPKLVGIAQDDVGDATFSVDAPDKVAEHGQNESAHALPPSSRWSAMSLTADVGTPSTVLRREEHSVIVMSLASSEISLS
eukprot:3111962-Rhodomonas_salina.1